MNATATIEKPESPSCQLTEGSQQRGVMTHDLVKQEAEMLETCWMVTPPEGKEKMRREHPEAIKALEECLGRPIKDAP